MKSNEKQLSELMEFLSSQTHVRPEEIPNIDLYMDQVTTMINNYAKNNLLPPPVKKKYSRDHMLMLIFIYYFKSLLSFHDIETFFGPITSRHFSTAGQSSALSLEDIYKEVFSLEEQEMEHLKADVSAKFSRAMDTFKDCPAGEGGQEYLRLFSFVCELSFDVYLKMRLIEKIADQLREDEPPQKKK